MSTDSIQRSLIAVSANEATHARLTSPAAVVATVASLQDAVLQRIFVYYWTRDVPTARAWLEAAARPAASDLSALAPAAMDAAMGDLWRAFGRFWQAMNLSPYAWAPFRKACERLWCPMPESNPVYWTPGRVVLVNNTWENNHLQPGIWNGRWREYAVTRFRQYGGGDGDPHDDVPAVGQVVFGAPRDFVSENIGCRPEGPDSLGRCQAPTGETHRVWLQYDGAATGGNLYPASVVNSALSWPDDGKFGVGHYWTADARWYRKPTIGQNVYWYIPSWQMYFDLLRAPQPGLRLVSGGPEVSLVEYLLGRDPYELAREVLLEVVKRNATMQSKWHIAGNDLASAASRLFDRAEAERQTDIRQVTSLTHAIGGLVTPFATLGPAGAVSAIVGGAIDLVVASTASLIAKNPDKSIDVFGRLMPAFEVAMTSPSYESFVHLMEEIGIPDGYAPPTITLTGLPAGASVTVDGSEPASATWSDDRTSVVIAGLPPGEHRVVAFVSRDARPTTIDTTLGAVSLPWTRMRPTRGGLQVVLNRQTILGTRTPPSSPDAAVERPPPAPPDPPTRAAPDSTGGSGAIALMLAFGAAAGGVWYFRSRRRPR